MGLRVGEYLIVIEDLRGQQIGDAVRTASSGHPAVGDEVLIRDVLYVVHRVRHEDEADGRTEREYTFARVFVRPATLKRVDSSENQPMARHSLVAIIVAAGYRAQATNFRALNRDVARLVREGAGWVLVESAPEELWRLSRLAKRYYAEVQALIQTRALSSSVSGPSQEPNASCPGAFQAPAQRPPSRRPALHLVWSA